MRHPLRHIITLRRHPSTYLICALLVLSSLRPQAGQPEPARQHGVQHFAPLHPDQSLAAGALKTEHGTGTHSLALLDLRIQIDRPQAECVRFAAWAGTPSSLASFLLYTETTSSRL
jgi:hypothetical protein